MHVHEKSRSVIFDAPDPYLLRSLLPKHTRCLGDSDEGNIAVKLNTDTRKVLANVGIETPNPLDLFYDWPGLYPPMTHQRTMIEVMSENKRCFNLSEMGTGKSYSSLWAADHLMKLKQVRRAVICCPLSIMETIWQQDIFDILMHRSCAIVHGSEEKRQKALNMDVDFYIVNHDGLAQPDVAKMIRRRKDIDLIILDEASLFRNHKTDKYKYLQWMLETKQWFWALTGTPVPNKPEDAWAVIRLINPDGVSKWQGNFKREVSVEVKKFKWVPRKGHEQIIFKAMQPAVRFKKKDCPDLANLPPQSTIRVQTRLSKAQEVAFKQMMEDEIITHNQQVKIGATITAVNAADKLAKLRQVLLGVVKNPITGVYEEIDHKPRIDDLEAVMMQAQAKRIIIFPFKGIIRSAAEELERRGHTCAILNGDVPKARRVQIIKDFKTKPDPMNLLCHSKVMAHGLNLTEADYTIFYGPIFSNDEYQQVIERNNRTGQKLPTTVVRMAAHPIEWAIYRTIDNRDKSQRAVLDLYNQFIGSVALAA